MNVSLGEKWDRFVTDQVASGTYQSASEVLREGLRLLEERTLLKRFSVSSLAELESKLLESAAKLDRGEGRDGEEVFARLRKQNTGRRKRG